MTNKEKIYIWFSLFEFNLPTLHKIINSYNNIEELLKISKYEGLITNFLSGAEFVHFIEKRDTDLPNLLRELEKGKIKYVCIDNQNYPKELRSLDYQPFVIYYCGNLNLLNYPSIAVLGSRVCSRYGKEQTQRFTSYLVESSLNIVSGLSDGIETYACETALQIGGKVIVVLPNGLDTIYPAFNTMLARRIVKGGGLVLSDKAPTFRARGLAFAQRNRLLAKITDALFLVEAGENSGTLHTINFGVDFGKEIFVLPANCNSVTATGSNNLIKKYYSACVTSPEEIVEKLKENFDLVTPNIEKEIDIKPIEISTFEQEINLNELEKTVVRMLAVDEMHFDEILEKTKIEVQKLMVLLTTLELRGIIKKLPGNYYTKKE